MLAFLTGGANFGFCDHPPPSPPVLAAPWFLASGKSPYNPLDILGEQIYKRLVRLANTTQAARVLDLIPFLIISNSTLQMSRTADEVSDAAQLRSSGCLRL